ncbi:hypothetical protein NQZ79_g7600 [Umbelopsis isabellina]|nr:hypothetical protein NQZ79_g7600 [Umbelopsis isabellina]
MLSAITRASRSNATRIGASNKYYSTDSTEKGPKKEYSETTKKLVFGLARMMGYYSTSSTAIRASHDLYSVCAKQVEENKKFYFQECSLPDNFQTWFSITQLHVWLLMVRLRAEDHGKLYIQELVNRFFEDAEDRMRLHGITSGRIINSYVKDLLAQFHGGVVAYDEGMCKDDPVLAAALWRNLFTPTTGNANDLAYIVQYIRRELKILDEYDSEKLNDGRVQFSTPVASFESSKSEI